MHGLIQDLRFAVRQLRKNPGFTAVAVLTLALGVGANTAIFTVIEAVVLRPLPFASPDRLVWLNGKFPQSDEAAVSPPDFLDYRKNNRSFEHLAALGYRTSPSNLSGEKPEQVLTTIASSGAFETLGIRPMLGRDFIAADEQANLPQVAILGYGIWKRDFAGDHDIIGRNIRLDGQHLTVIGVLPTDLPLLNEAQIWLPMPLLNPGMNIRLAHFLKAIGRLRPGVTMQQSQADLDAIAAQLAKQYPDTNKGWSLRQRSLAEVLIGPIRPALLMIWAAVGLLLLIACANLANLFLTRSISRRREYAVRAALGATRARMAQQALTESVVLALMGGALGVFAATWGVSLLHVIGPSGLPRSQEIHFNMPVLIFAVGISLLTGTLFGLLPALQISKDAFDQGFRESARTTAPAAHRKLRAALVVGEIAVSLVLLVGAGLLIKSFWLLIHVNPGFQTEHVLTARLSLNGPGYNHDARKARFWQELTDRISNLPGVEAAGAVSELPLGGEGGDNPFHIPGRSYGPSEFDDAFFRQVMPGYRAAMGIPLIAGRWLDQRDRADSPGTIVVDQAFARRFFPGENAIGKRLQLMGDPQAMREIVGIVGNVSHTALSDPQRPEMYIAYAQYQPPTMNLVVRATANPNVLAAALYETVRAVDKDETLSAVRTLDDVVDASVSQPRFSSLLLTLFALLALVLSAVGLYGVMAYSVTQRTNEIGIRMALGARQHDVLKMVISQGMKLAGIGVLIGLASALVFGRVLASMLYRVRPSDGLTFALASVGLAVVALVASYVPARRATKVDPMIALRYE
jgi:putative ABC transport system permease protein